jgi:lauroyl/myristoyl acyltransferase
MIKMKKYVLFYTIDDYPNSGGGEFYEFFDRKPDMTDKLNELTKQYGSKFIFVRAGYLTNDVKYRKVEIITRYEEV